MKKLTSFVFIFALMVSCCGCSGKITATAPPNTDSNAEAATSTPTETMQISNTLLENVMLTLPENITREDISKSRAYFNADGSIVGGIEILDIPGQRDAFLLDDDYTNWALTVTKLVRSGEYDRSVDKSSSLADVEVDIAFRDGQLFVHYFFFGENVVYDIWVDRDALDAQDMISILKTLYSEDIINPQDNSPVNEDTPILNLRIDLPEGIQRMPATTTRILFYNIPSLDVYVTGENVAGGVEAIADSNDLKAIETVITSLGQKYMGGDYKTTVQEYTSCDVLAEIIATNSESELVAYIVNIDEDAYAVWANTSIISQDEILKIAASCSY